jgi:hypothetical protein
MCGGDKGEVRTLNNAKGHLRARLRDIAQRRDLYASVGGKLYGALLQGTTTQYIIPTDELDQEVTIESLVSQKDIKRSVRQCVVMNEYLVILMEHQHNVSTELAKLDHVMQSDSLTFEAKVKEGWWDYEKFAEHVHDMIDLFNWRYAHCQLLLEVDHSSGHLRKKENGLSVAGMNLGWGGKQVAVRDTSVPADSLGDKPGLSLIAGQIQRSTFAAEGPPPFYDREAPKDDTTFGQLTAAVRGSWANSADGKKWAKANTDKEPPADHVCFPGYVGKPKGVYQLLYERGLYHKDMRGTRFCSPDQKTRRNASR